MKNEDLRMIRQFFILKSSFFVLHYSLWIGTLTGGGHGRGAPVVGHPVTRCGHVAGVIAGVVDGAVGHGIRDGLAGGVALGRRALNRRRGWGLEGGRRG